MALTAAEKRDIEKSALFGKLRELADEAEKKEAKKIETFSLFVGQPRSGKTSLLGIMHKGEREVKPTLALDFSFARRTNNKTNQKDVANIWELGGEIEELAGVAIPARRLQKALLGVVVDLSSPVDAVNWLARWLRFYRSHVSTCLGELRRENEETANAMIEAAKRRYGKTKPHPDARSVDPLATPLLIIANKWDLFKNEDAARKKVVGQALRYLAHSHGATLAYASARDKPMQTKFRTLLGYALFLKSDPKTPPSTDHEAPVYVPVGSDTFAAIAEAGPIAHFGTTHDQAYRVAVQAVTHAYGIQPVKDFGFVDEDDETKKPDRDDDVDDMWDPKYAEPVIDNLYRQRLDDLMHKLADAKKQRASRPDNFYWSAANPT
ncbi:hypothetical protein CTAYLR_004265 [Chrysophaeum taylorii]|uniref:Cytoplasmic dynein 2 light intermediate chain 1 n=1 Tax=Chrysophaeum taylorii TaxID=2483200 RepID=A0AAD7UGF5_9STRA|nr:hypothetical protein CTAYLR_004265 [Chrysophaeum taylorii]